MRTASSEGLRQSSFRRVIWRAAHLVAWLAVLVLLVLAALRIFYHDGAYVLIWLNAFTRYVYVPAYVSLAWAVWQRRWMLAATAAAVVVAHLTFIAPDFLPDRRFDAAVGSQSQSGPNNASPVVRIFFANVMINSTEYEAMLREIAIADPDVIVLVEYGWGWHRAFKASPVMKPYVYGSGHEQRFIGAINMFSRLPLKSETHHLINGRPMHSIDIDLGSQTLRVIGIHGPRPIDQPKYDYERYWNAMIPQLTAAQGPLVVVGDFNATQHSAVYKRLRSLNLRSAHDDRGRGYAATWPNGKFWLPPIRIDQAFLSPQVECERIAEGIGEGSDHKPLIVDVRIRGS
jgi:endonuclease/exonuclease/phosphatase (EEP) superfamily protein YafD